LFSAGAGSGDLPSLPENRHVSLANIATAFLSERKSSSTRRQSSGRRQKRLTVKENKPSKSRHQSSFSSATNDILGQQSSSGATAGRFSAIFMTNVNATGANNKHRVTLVIKIYLSLLFVFLTSLSI